MTKLLISTCLLNIKTQWDEDCKNIEKLRDWVREGKAIFCCPEQLGGLSTPRIPCEIECGKTAKDILDGNGKVLGKDGADYTKQFVKGARYILDICKDFGVEYAVLKAKSPSCGDKQIFDGTFLGKKIEGKGILAQLLSENGIKIYNETDFPEDLV